jgi:hypothetical protein
MVCALGIVPSGAFKNHARKSKMSYINMSSVFASLDARKAAAEAFISQFSAEQVAEAARIASLYAIAGSIKHKEAIVQALKNLSK